MYVIPFDVLYVTLVTRIYIYVRGGDLDSFQDIRYLPVYGAKNNLIGSWPTKHLMHHYNTLEKNPFLPIIVHINMISLYTYLHVMLNFFKYKM